MAKIKKTIKSIKVDADKCNGCRSCEIICSAFHSTPKYSVINPARARIRIILDPQKDIWFPVFAGDYTPAECLGRESNVIDGKEYPECALCRASCPARDRFKEPDSGLPLKCDLCEDEPPQEKPLCVQWCLNNVLVYEEREEEVEEAEEAVKMSEMEVGLRSLVDKYGLQTLVEGVTRMVQKD